MPLGSAISGRSPFKLKVHVSPGRAGSDRTPEKIPGKVRAKAVKPEIPGIEHAITSGKLSNLKQQPKHLAVLNWVQHSFCRGKGIIVPLRCGLCLIPLKSFLYF